METNKNQGFEEGTLDFSDISKLIDNGIKEPEDTLKLEDLNTVEVTDDNKVKDEEVNTNIKDEKEVVQEQKPREDEVNKPKSEGSLDYNSIKNKLLEKGLWEDVTLEIGDEEKDLSNLDDLDEETFLAILEEQNKIKESEIKDSSINKEGLDDMTLKLIDISKAGGDITDIVKQYDEHVNPLNGLDLTDPKTQEALIINQLRRQNLSDIVIKNSVLEMRSNGTVEDSANQIVQNTNKIFNKYLDDKKQQAEDKKRDEVNSRNEFKKDLSSVYKEEFGLDVKVANRLVKFGTNDNFIQDKYKEVMSDPKLASELIFFLEDQEAYLKYKNNNRDRVQKINTLKKINIIGKKDRTSSKSTDDNKKETKSTFTFEEIKD
jgi:hypothetical protein